MARKDVELVIRAKDEATKAIGAIGDALKTLTKAQGDLSTTGDKADSSLEKLGKAIGDLDKKFQGLTVVGRVQQQLDSAAASATRLEQSTAGLADKQARLAIETKAAADSTGKLVAEQEAAAGAVRAQEQAVKAATTAQQAQNKALKDAGVERQKAVRDEQSLAQQIEAQQAAVVKAAARYGDLASRMAATSEPSDRLKASMQEANEAMALQDNKLANLVSRQDGVREKVLATAAAETQFAAAVTQAGTVLANEQASLQKTQISFQEIQAAVKAAAINQKSLEAEASNTAGALARETAALAQARTEISTFTAISQQAGIEQKRLALAIREGLSGELERQRALLGPTQAAWAEATAAVSVLAEAMRAAGTPSKELQTAFDKSKEAAARTKAEFLAVRDNVGLLSSALREGGGSFDRLVAQQQRYAANTRDTSNATNAAQIAARATAAAQAALAGETKRAEDEIRKLNTELASTAQNMNKAEAESFSLANALKSIYGESRTAMSWTQRLRGEVLSLVAAYAGIFGAVQGIKNLVEAYTTLQAAQSRLNVAFQDQGGPAQSAKELEFVRRTSERLGIQFGVLASEYGKFALSTQGTDLAGAATRKIFIAVAEAARVSKVSVEDMKGVFTALTQIVSKGAVQMEELRQQLGDRLPGAIQLMADGLGVSTAQLLKMMEAGEVTSKALIGFADKLQQKFGPGLALALSGTEAQIGNLQNAAFQALLTIGDAGFIGRFNELLKALNTQLRSPDAVAFFEKIGAGLGKLADFLTVAVNHWQLLTAAVSAFIGVKVAGVITAIGGALLSVGGPVERFHLAMMGTAKAAVAAEGAIAGTTAAVGGLRVGMGALLGSTGVGLVITAIAVGISYWATRADEATEALVKHQKQVDDLKNSYETSGLLVEVWAKRFNDLNATESDNALKKLKDKVDDLTASLVRPKITFFPGDESGRSFIRPLTEAEAQIESIRDAFKKGTIDAKELRRALDDVAQSHPTLGDEEAQRLQDLTKEIVKYSTAVERETLLNIAAKGSAEEKAAALKKLAEGTELVGGALAQSVSPAKAFEDQLNKIKGVVPSLKAEMELLKKEMEIKGLLPDFEKLLDILNKMPATVGEFRSQLEKMNKDNPLRFVGQALSEIDKERLKAQTGIDTNVSTDFAKNVIRFESGGRPNARNDTSSAVGVGQFIEDTWIKLFKQYFPDRAENMSRETILALREDAKISEAMINAYAAQNSDILSKAGVSVDRAALQLAHLLGPGGAIKVLKADPETALSDLFSEKVIGGNARIMRGKTAGDLVETMRKSQNLTNDELAVSEAVTKELQKQADEKEKADGKTRQRIDDLKSNVDVQEQLTAKQRIEAEVLKAVHAARKENANITDEQVKQVEALARAAAEQKFRADDAKNAEKEVNQLFESRKQLQEQLKAAMEIGETDVADRARTGLVKVNQELAAAIPKAIALWQALGGPESEKAISKLQTAQLTISKAGKQTWIDWNKVGELFASKLTTAFDEFAKAVSEGKSVGEAASEAFKKFASDFLREIAQMIIKQAILNALRAAFPSMGFGGTPLAAGIAHSGGVAGSFTRSRMVDPAIFQGAMRYHTGGFGGLAPGEVPAVLQRNEEVLTTSDPRHAFNLGSGSISSTPAVQPSVKVVNAFDPASFLSEALNSKVGEKAILNHVRANPGAWKAAMG